MYKNLPYIIFLLLLCSCSSMIYKDTPKEYLPKERIEKAKNFAEAFFNKCKNNDYTEFQGFDIDINYKKGLASDELKKKCEKISARAGEISLGEFNNSITASHPIDYMDLLFFKAKSSTNDSVKYVAVGLYRDKDFIYGITLTNRSTPKIHYKIKK